MFKSLFTRTIVTYFTILLIVLGLIGIYLSVSISQSVFNDKTEQLTAEAEQINQWTASYNATEDQSLKIQMFEQLTMQLQGMAIKNHAVIWIQYESVETSPLVFSGVDGLSQKISDSAYAADIKKILAGNTIKSTDYFLDDNNEQVLTIGIPMTNGDEITGAIFINTPVHEMNDTYSGIFPRLWGTVFIAAMVGIIAISFTSIRMINPLIEMNSIAKDISKGKFDRRAKVESADELGQLAESFNNMANELSNTEEMRKNFIANVSHELRSPLTSIIGFVQGIRDGTINESDRDMYLDIVLDEAKRLTKLIRELLDLSQIEAGKFPLNRSHFELNDVIARVLLRQTARIEANNLDVDVNFGTDRCIVDADIERIEQVLTNLIDNAIKYVGDEKLIKIWTIVSGNKVFVSVSNSGTIPQDDMLHIFDRFYIGDKARSPGAGTGLGLSIVKKILEQHGEDIWAKNVQDSHVIFTFSLPVVNEGDNLVLEEKHNG